jgi:hypothetical protein
MKNIKLIVVVICLFVTIPVIGLFHLNYADAEDVQTNPYSEIFSDAEFLVGMKGVGPKPLIKKKTVSELQREFCNSGKCNIVALYHSEYNQIWVRSDFDFTDDKYYESILLHETVHWIQYSNHLYENELKDCQLWLKREYQAYQLQGKWLFNNNSVVSVSIPVGLSRVCS